MKKTNLGWYAGVLLLALVSLAYLGGLPAPEELPFFILGAVVLVGLSLLIGGLAWFFLYRPLPDNYKISSESPFSPFWRQVLGIVLIINMSLVALGGAWDEAWHGLYGIPFGEDFFWRPHILIYIGLITLILFALVVTVVFLRKGKGTIAQRLRSDVLLAVLIFVGLFMVYALPADPLWHTIYGEDITAFSIPHVLLSFMFVIPLLVGTGIFVSSYPKRNWQSILSLRWFDAPPIVAFVMIELTLYMLFAANWELLAIRPDFTGGIVERVPEWLFPLLVIFVASFVGILANHSLRYYGAATLVGLLSFGLRLLLLRMLGHQIVTANTWMIALVIHLAIDVFYFIRRSKIPNWWQAGLVAGLAMAILGLPLINWLYPTPQTSLGNLLLMVLGCFGGALLAAWFAQAIGDYLAESPHYLAEETGKMQLTAVTSGVSALALAFLLWFILTATPPV